MNFTAGSKTPALKRFGGNADDDFQLIWLLTYRLRITEMNLRGEFLLWTRQASAYTVASAKSGICF